MKFYNICLKKHFLLVIIMMSGLLMHCSPAVSQERAGQNQPWYETARIFYDWIRIGEDLDEDYARHVVEKTKNLNCNTLAFSVQVGGYALWDSDITPKYDRIGNMDLIGELAELCEKNDIYFVPYWLATAPGVARVLEEHPGWAFLGPVKDDGSQQRWHYVCYNSPYRDLVYEEVREILSNYRVDGIYFDQLPGSCYCPFCRNKYKRIYNQPMPNVSEEEVVPLLHKAPPAQFPTLLREFRATSIRGFCAGIRSIIDEIQPGACYIQNWINGDKARLGIGLVDVVLPEFYQSNDLIPLGEKHRITRAYFDNGPLWGNVRHAVRHDARHFPVCGTQMLLVDCVANHAAPLMLDLSAMDFDPTGAGELAVTFSDISRIQELISQSDEVPYAKLLHSLPTYENYFDEYMESFEGLYRLLFEAHIPFDIVTEENVRNGGLYDTKVLIIPNAVFLSNQTVDAVRKAVGNGMGLIATHLTGFRDSRGQQRAKPALSDLFGIQVQDVIANDTREGLVMYPDINVYDIDTRIFYYGSARTQHKLAVGLPEKGLFSFQGGFVACQPEPGTQVIADIHPPDHTRLYATEYNRRGVYPGKPRWPLAVVRETGNARVAYFASQSDAQWRRAHAPELSTLLINTVKWAGGPVPLSTPDVPASVEVRLFHDVVNRKYMVLLVNQTTNPLSAPGEAHIGVIRYITHHKNIELVLHSDVEAHSIVSLKGSSVKYTSDEGALHIHLDKLSLYDCIVIEYK